MQQFSALPHELLVSVWRNWGLIAACVKRDVLGRYRGSMMGLLWSFFNPLFMLMVYTFVFSVVFKARWSVGGDSKTEFALVLFAGLLVFNFFAECINRAPVLILSNTNYVKKVVFPLEILSWVAVGSAMFHCMISLGVWCLAYIIFFGTPHATWLLLPLIIFPLVLFVVGCSWFLASLGVYLRDVSQFTGIITTALMFMSPIFYPASALPDNYRALLFLNPLTFVVEQVRAVLFFGEGLDVFEVMAVWGVAALVAGIGFAWFQMTRKGFADVL